MTIRITLLTVLGIFTHKVLKTTNKYMQVLFSQQLLPGIN